MVVVAHNDVAEKVETEFFPVVRQQIEQHFLAGVVIKEELPVVAPLDDMVNPARIFYTWLSAHGPSFSE